LRNAKAIRALIFAFIVSGFVLGVLKLFLLRFEAGDVYPAYSSLRSDPVGSRAFYSSLENINDTVVGRNYLPLQNVEFKENTAFFYIVASVFDSDSVSAEWFEVFERLTNAGGRLVLSFLPVEKKPAGWRLSKCAPPRKGTSDSGNEHQEDTAGDNENFTKPHTVKKRSNAPDSDDKQLEKGPDPSATENQRNCVTLKEKWGLLVAFAEKPADKAVYVGDDLSPAPEKGLPPAISWHTAMYFDDLDDDWRTIYAADGRPVIVERSLGSGSLVLSADSFFMSNEALRAERHPQLLAWMLGASAAVIFDETHLGIFKQPGVMNLIKKFRFHWFILTVAVLALLFIWKNCAYFVPPRKGGRAQEVHDFISDRDSSRGLISLLRRNIPAGKILQVCIREWERTNQPEKRFQKGQLAKIRSTFKMIASHSSKTIDPVAGYRQISKIISKGRYDE
jgi:hypothetical protein